MRQAQLLTGENRVGHVWKLAAIAILLAGSFAAGARAQQKGQKTFATPAEASQALFAAAKSNDEKALLELFGPNGKEIVNSGDSAADEQSRAHFAQRYEEMHRLVWEPDGTVAVYIGAHNWPYPISLRKKGTAWYFDTDAGKQEVLYRRIGFNEISAMRICEELVAAQKDFSQQNNQYAQKIISDGGKKDGLYWTGIYAMRCVNWRTDLDTEICRAEAVLQCLLLLRGGEEEIAEDLGRRFFGGGDPASLGNDKRVVAVEGALAGVDCHHGFGQVAQLAVVIFHLPIVARYHVVFIHDSRAQEGRAIAKHLGREEAGATRVAVIAVIDDRAFDTGNEFFRLRVIHIVQI